MRRVTKVIAAYSTYIDPSDADSTVSYKIVRGVRLWGDVCLTDCNRKINWSFYNDPLSVKKIDTVIKTLQDFRTAFVAAQKVKVARKTRSSR